MADLVITTQAAELLLNYRLLWHQRRDGPRVAYWGHGRNFGPRPNRFAEATKAWSSRRVHWWFAYTERSAEIVAELGYPRDRITVVDNAIDTTALRSHLEAVTAPRLAELRRELDLGHGPVGLFLGSLRADKRLDLLLDAAARVHERQEGFRLVVVGSGPQATMVRERAVREPWVRVLGSRYGRAQAELLALADLLLLPGAVGLVALDSLASATPLVASADATHGPELAYLRHRENALVVPGGDDPRRYAAAIVEALEDRSLADGLVAGCEQVADQYTLEGMIGRFSDGITRALAAPLLPR